MKKTLLLLATTLIITYSFSQVATNLETLSSNLKVKIEVGTATTTLTLEGPSTAWFAVGFGGSTMAAGADVFRTNGTAIVDAKATGRSLPPADANQDWTQTSNTVSGTVRTIVATRANNTGDANDYTFTPTMTSLAVIWAYGASTTYANHGATNRGATMLSFSAVTTPCTKPNKGVTKSGTTLTATETGATYQWLDCGSNKEPIMNETNKTFTPTTIGSYAVEVTKNNCKDTSICTAVCINYTPMVTKVGTTLSTPNVIGATYSWSDCDITNANAIIPGATARSYTATANGRYAVAVLKNGCLNRSVCTAVIVSCTTNRPVVTVAGATLSTRDVSGASFRWLSCSNNAYTPIGVTRTSYTPSLSGSYAVEITRADGCKDTSACMTATVVTPPCVKTLPTVTVNGAMLSTNLVAGETYRWLDCGSNNMPVANETSNSFTATANGMYAVEITRTNNCKDTSACTAVTGVGLVENTFASGLKFYPNPTSDNVTIELGNNYSDIAVEITNILGQVVTRKNIATVTNRKIVLPIEASSGIYFVRVEAKEGFASFRVVKE